MRKLRAERGAVVVGRRLRRRILGIARRQLPWQDRSAFAHVHDLGTRKARKHRLHERLRAYAGLELSLPRVVLRSDRRLTRLGRYHHHPAPICPLRELAREIVDQRLRGASLQPDLESTVLAAHQPHVALERKLEDRKSTRLNSSHLGISYA